MLEYIKNVHGFQDENITILMDDGQHTEPTYANILAAYKKIVADSQPGDAVFCHYSGHGGKLRDDDGDEKDGYVGDSQSRSIWHPFRFSYRHLHLSRLLYSRYDETLVPVDFASAGQIRDDDIFSTLIGPMSKGVVMTCGE